MEKTGLSATNVKVEERRQRSASLSIQRRRQRLIALRSASRRFSVGKAAEALCVSRWTVERDLAFLEKYDLLTIRRNTAFPFESLESGEEFMRRFQAAHRA
jgi:DeoR/GlpR family transcriptional regulator of sugar metabolism